MNTKHTIPVVVYLLGLTIFVVTTAEFMVAGMMPALSVALRVSVGEVGYLISLYAFGMAIGGPVLTALLLAFRMPNKPALLWLLILYAAAGVLAAMATSYAVMAGARIVMGVASSACFGVSLSICADLVEPQERGRTSSLVFGGLMLAPVLGVPVTVFIEQLFDWRASFWAVALLSMLCTVLVGAFVPASKKDDEVSLAAEFRSLFNGQLWAAFTTSGLIIGAAFAAFSYFSPIFIEVSGASPSAIPWLLAVYGAANVVGNLIVGRLADRYTMQVLAGGLGILAVALGVFALLADNLLVSIGAFLTIGLTGVALNPAMVARVMRAATPGPLVNTMHTSLITLGLAFGAWAGGVTIDAGYGLVSPLWVGLGLAVAGLVSVLPYLRGSRKTTKEPECTVDKGFLSCSGPG